jgi:hypothetical protein
MATRGGGGTKPRDLVVRFLSDVAGFIKGTDDVADALDDVSRSMDETARDADTSSEKIARDYEAAAERMERSTDEFTRDLAASYRTAANRVRTENAKIERDTRDTLGDAGREAGSEFAQNLGESISSGDVAGLASGTIGGLAASFGATGPIGLALAGLGAAAVGVFTAIRTNAEKAATAAQSAFDLLLEGASREAVLRARLEDAFGSYEAGFDVLARAAGGSLDRMDELSDAIIDGKQPARETADALRDAADAVGRINARPGKKPDGGLVVSKQEADASRTLATELDKIADATDRAAVAEERRAAALRLSARYYAGSGSAYAPGGSTYQSQVPYDRGGRG